MKLSIVITTKNRKADLLECIASLKNSSFKDFELIIVDDFSNDGTDLLTKNDFNHPEVEIFHSKTNLMLVEARNQGRELAKGQNILFVDEDNILAPGLLDHLVEA